MKNIVAMVSGGGTNLQAIFDAIDRGEIDGQVTMVISSARKAYALERARMRGIPTLALPLKAFKTPEECQQARHDALVKANPDLIVLAGFLTILSADFTARWPSRILNVHPSLIPAFCGKGFYGLHVHEAALAYGVKVTGATVHLVNEIPDGGRILLQKAVEVEPGDTPEALQRRVMEQAEWQLLPKAIAMVCNGEV